ncbi:MAG: glucosamine--fructose-6-phosphate aminotransferase [Gammaproteobacteria bacterium]
MPQSGLPVTRLENSLRAWGTDAFAGTLKADILGLGAGVLPLQVAAAGGCVAEDDVEITVLGSTDDAAEIHVNVGVFFAEIIAGCSCGDAPSTSNAYCELRVSIEKATGLARFAVIQR